MSVTKLANSECYTASHLSDTGKDALRCPHIAMILSINTASCVEQRVIQKNVTSWKGLRCRLVYVNQFPNPLLMKSITTYWRKRALLVSLLWRQDTLVIKSILFAHLLSCVAEVKLNVTINLIWDKTFLMLAQILRLVCTCFSVLTGRTWKRGNNEVTLVESVARQTIHAFWNLHHLFETGDATRQQQKLHKLD